MNSIHLAFWKSFLTILCVLTDGFTDAAQSPSVELVPSSNGFGYELIQTKLDYLEHRFTELFADLKKDHQDQKRLLENLVKRMENKAPTNTTQVADQIRKILEAVDPTERHLSKGEWLVVMQRLDGSEDFNRGWTDYRDGFGTVGEEFWLGLEKLHQLTKDTPYELLIRMKDFGGNLRYARYSKFAIGSEAESYSLKEVGSYSGTAGDSLTWHKGCQFSATDRGPFQNCVRTLNGGWWYKGWDDGKACYASHLTGEWNSAHGWNSITWNTFGQPAPIALKYVRMSIRKL